MLKKNQLVEFEITGITTEGNGVGRYEGMAVFVPFTAVGDFVSVKIVKVLKSYSYGIINEIITPSPDRTESDCPVSQKCGGCMFRHITYDAELRIKSGFVTDSFRRIGGFELDYEEIAGCEHIDHYRNKAQYPVAPGPDGKAVCGFYSRRSHRIVPFTECRLQPVVFRKIVDFVIEHINKNCISAYDETTGKGLVRHIYIRQGFHSGKIMLCIVVSNKKAIPLIQTMLSESLLTEKFPEIVSVVVNINPENTNVILGKKCVTVYGEDNITDVMCENKISLSPFSFYQVNTPQAELLYSIAADYAELTGNEEILDLYCGAGTIGLSMHDKVKTLTGVEVIEQAVENARTNAAANNIKNAEFICGDAGHIADKLLKDGKRPDVVIVDPPRKGCDNLTLDSIVRMKPERIVMISCNPATAARDCKILCSEENGYEIKRIRGVDLFPRTGHVETVVCLSREKAMLVKKETKMIYDEKSGYKSWSNLKKQMHDLLCDSLKDKISYFYTSYHEVHNAYGRATINYSKKEIVAFSWVEMYKQEQEVSQLYSQGKKVSYGEIMKKWMPECKLCDADFINSLTIYLKTDIAASLNSDNYLLRVFAYMDRRVGKRTLVKIKDDVEKLPDWVKQFYQIRCEADGIVFPPK
ncbi:MAG: 23S rRNA (uracil(1939)-C(5))-methyltransferase RlmD [Ruminococcus sp.]|nr:23S rRNA (uracil(1939)-C(5))-methyltransferase RlmD [Ruminococcus sp.]